MNRPLQWWRRQGWGGRLLVVLAVFYLAYILIAFFVLPDWLREKGETMLSDTLGRPVTIERLELNPFTLSTTVENFAIGDPDTDTLASFKRLYVNVEFWASLFHWRPWIGQLHLDGLDVRLRRAEDGSLNVEDVIARLAEGEASADEQQNQEKADEAKELLALTVAHLSLSNGAVSFIDGAGEKPVVLTLPVAFTVEDLSTRAPGQGDNRYELHVQGPDGGTLDWSGRFELSPLTIQGSLKMAGVDLVSFAELLEPRMRFSIPSGQLGLAADYRFSAEPGAGLQVTDGSLSLRELSIVPQGSEQPTLTLPELDVRGLSLDAAEHTVTVLQTQLSGPALRAIRNKDGIDLATLFLPRESVKPEQVEQTTQHVGKDAEPAESGEDSAAWRVVLKELGLKDIEITLRDETLPEAAELQLTEGVLDLVDVTIADDITWQWSGSAILAKSGHLAHSGQGRLEPLQVDAKLKLDALPLTALAPWVADATPIALREGVARGDLALNISGDVPALRITGGAGLDQVALLEHGASAPFVSLAGLDASGLDINTDQQSAVVANLSVRGFDLRYGIDKEGRDLISRLVGDTRSEGSAGEGTAWRVRLNQASVKDSRLSHLDASMPMPFRVSLERWNASLKDFDTGGGKAAIDMSGRVNGNAPLKVKGSIDPDPLLVELAVSLNGYGMDNLTPYTGRYLGYTVQRGLLSLETAVKIDNQNLHSDTAFAADRFFLGDIVASEDAINAPVKLGLAVLRDASGMIQLPLKVSGDMSDPNFTVTGVVFRVIRNVLVKTATAPFSLLASLMGGKNMEYIDFPPGDPIASAEVDQSLAMVANMLGDRPQLTLEVIGQTDRKDRQALAEAELIDAFGGDWPGVEQAVADAGALGYQSKILKVFEERLNTGRDTLGVEGDDDDANTERARQAWARLMEKGITDVKDETLLELAVQRGESARQILIEKQQLDADRLQLGQPVVDGDVAGIKLGLGSD